MRHVLELLVARAETRGAAEVVDRDRVIAGLREALGELRVERIQAADVGEDHDPAAAVRAGPRRARPRNRVPSAEVSSSSSRPRAAGDRGEQQVLGRRRRPRVEVEAHADRQNTGMTEATTSATDPTTFRAQFPVLERLSYLNAGTEGPIPEPRRERGRRRDRNRGCRRPVWARRTSKGSMGLAEPGSRRLRGRAGLRADEVALTGSTTDGVNTVIAGLDLRPGDEI